jgi:hypothetical protein
MRLFFTSCILAALSGPALSKPPVYPADAISTSDEHPKIDHRKDAAWMKVIEKAKAVAHNFGWPGVKRECDKQAEASPLPEAKPVCEMSIEYKVYGRIVGETFATTGGDIFPYLAFVIWTVDEKTGETLSRNVCRSNSAANLLTCVDFDTGWKWLAKAFIWGDGPNAGGEWRSLDVGDSRQIEGDD